MFVFGGASSRSSRGVWCGPQHIARSISGGRTYRVLGSNELVTRWTCAGRGYTHRMPTRVPRASSTRRGARTRAEILRAAVPLFVRNGYRGAPLAAVADAAQLTQP